MLSAIFNSDAFKLESMVAAINEVDHLPTRVREMGIHTFEGVRTTTVVVEQDPDTLALIPSTPRDAPANQNATAKRKVRDFRVPHLPLEDSIMASEIQDVREFGQPNQLKSVESERNKRLAKMARKHQATLEHILLGSIKGVILDADGSSVIYDLFDEFEVTQEDVDFALATSGTEVLLKCMATKRLVEDALGGLAYRDVHVLCGSEWWDKFITHPNVKEAYKYFQANGQNQLPLRDDLRFGGFRFGGMVFEEYRGKVSGVDFIEADEAHAFPVGVPDLFVCNFSPGTFMEAVNTVGLPMYAKAELGKYGRSIDIWTESNPLALCTRPLSLIKLTTN
jgi:hypothetical protein